MSSPFYRSKAELFGKPLSPRESEIVQLITDRALSTKEIAWELRIEYNTAMTHVSNIYAKLGVHNRVELTIWKLKGAAA